MPCPTQNLETLWQETVFSVDVCAVWCLVLFWRSGPTLLRAVITLPPVTKLGLEIILSSKQEFLIFQEIMYWLPPLCTPSCSPREPLCLRCPGTASFPTLVLLSFLLHLCPRPLQQFPVLEPFHSAVVPVALLTLPISGLAFLLSWELTVSPLTPLYLQNSAVGAISCLAWQCSAELSDTGEQQSRRFCWLLDNINLKTYKDIIMENSQFWWSFWWRLIKNKLRKSHI